MIAQYTAASLVSENKVLAHPTSVDTIPTSGNQEDHVSMGWTSMRKLREVVANVRAVLAVEILAAAQAHRLPGRRSPRRAPAQRRVPTAWCAPRCRRWTADREVADQIATVDRLLPELVAAAEGAVGALDVAVASPLAWFGGRLATGLRGRHRRPDCARPRRLVGGGRRPSRAS